MARSDSCRSCPHAKELARRGTVDASRFDPERLADPEVNIEYGAAYLRYLVERYHEVEVALAAYNAGLANADAWAAEGGDIRAQIEFPETKHFVLKVSRGKDRYEALYPDRSRSGAVVEHREAPGAPPADRRSCRPLRVESPFEPAGDQPKAIAELVRGVEADCAIRRCSASPVRARPSRWPR